MANEAVDLIKSSTDFSYRSVNLKDLKAVPLKGFSDKFGAGARRNVQKTGIDIGGEIFDVSPRFWTSFAARTGVSTNVFNLFDHGEVFNRVVERHALNLTGNIRIAEDRTNNRLLAISDPSKSIMTFEQLAEVLERNNGQDIRYADGVVTSMHDTISSTLLNIGDEEYLPKICVETPIDGYGDPKVYLSLLRLICTNGMIGHAKAFKTIVKLGANEDPMFTMNRMFDSYSNDEGMDAIARRLTSAQNTWLSVDEAHRIMRIVSRWTDKLKKGPAYRIQKSMVSLFGNISSIYGIVSLDDMNRRQKSMLPTRATVADSIHMLSELVTHHTNKTNEHDGEFSRSAYAEIGELLSKPSGFDLEDDNDEQDKALFKERIGRDFYVMPEGDATLTTTMN